MASKKTDAVPEPMRVTVTVPGELVLALWKAQSATLTRPPITQLVLAAIEKVYA